LNSVRFHYCMKSDRFLFLFKRAKEIMNEFEAIFIFLSFVLLHFNNLNDEEKKESREREREEAQNIVYLTTHRS
jgi:hypothetical protein